MCNIYALIMSKKHILSKTRTDARTDAKTDTMPVKTKVLTCCETECRCPVCFEDKKLQKLLQETTTNKIISICKHYVCEECIGGIIDNRETTICVCPLCRKPFTHYGCNSNIKSIDDYESDNLQSDNLQNNFSKNYSKNSIMRTMKGGKRRRKQRKTRRQQRKK
jgi:hypothetical protein